MPKSRSTPQNHHKKQQQQRAKQTNTKTKLQKVNNIQWDMANTTTNKGENRKRKTKSRQRDKDRGRGSGMQPVLASLLLQHSLPHLVQHPEVSADKMLKMYLPQKRRDATLQAAASSQQAATATSTSRRDGCSLLIAGALNGSAAL